MTTSTPLQPRRSHGPRRDIAALEQRRLAAAELFAAGAAQAEVARTLGASPQSAHRWHARWRHGGVAALRAPARQGGVTELPTLPSGDAGSATVVYQLPAPHRVLAELLDVGARVRLCAPATSPANPPCHPDPLEVLAVHPAGPGSADAWLLLGLPSTAQAAVHRYLTADGRYLVVAQ